MGKRNGIYVELTLDDLKDINTLDDYRRCMPDLRNQFINYILRPDTREDFLNFMRDSNSNGFIDKMKSDLEIEISGNEIEEVVEDLEKNEKVTKEYLYSEACYILELAEQLQQKSTEMCFSEISGNDSYWGEKGDIFIVYYQIHVNICSDWANVDKKETMEKVLEVVTNCLEGLIEIEKIYNNSPLKGLVKNPDKTQIDQLKRDYERIIDNIKRRL